MNTTQNFIERYLHPICSSFGYGGACLRGVEDLRIGGAFHNLNRPSAVSPVDVALAAAGNLLAISGIV